MIYFHRYRSPLGPMLLLADERALTGVYFESQRYFPRWNDDWRENSQSMLLQQASAELDEYFAGRRQQFETLLEPRGTEFQRRVWSALCTVEYGVTASYAELARRSDCAGGVRAVGAAIGRNPLSILIPCHRIIGADGSLTGYAGGLEKKAALLELESKPAYQAQLASTAVALRVPFASR